MYKSLVKDRWKVLWIISEKCEQKSSIVLIYWNCVPMYFKH